MSAPTTFAPELRVYGSPRIRMAPLETVREERDAPVVLEGRAVPYGVAEQVSDEYGTYFETIAPGAFRKSTKEAARALPLMLWHDHDAFPIGRAIAWREELDGLYGAWELDSSPRAQEAGRLAREGLLTGLSVGFAPMAGRSTVDPATRDSLARVVHHEGRLLETSLCAVPAYAGAGVTLVRTAGRPVGGQRTGPAPAPRPALAEWQNWRANLTT
ncbi:HK97 family phage prohead protease [Phytomonospora endophytica]|uniref:Prohead serine protease domain-containing protein n=1 Tax=Phytomonospora endophytica TaxID=714109 RepID=A0A841FPU4_9ACTN|nr:HK97 family phage prohead protease [Phytomonospora endophytica]MBB6039321.1 hypothetical protein [Phytomonospora endophytica]GIG69737.1 prophage protease [Phytomonospora endophytica]